MGEKKNAGSSEPLGESPGEQGPGLGQGEEKKGGRWFHRPPTLLTQFLQGQFLS